MSHPVPSRTGPALSVRGQILVVALVGALSAVVCAFYVWAVALAVRDDPLLTVPSAWAYAAWGASTLLSAGLLWWHQRHPVAVFVGVLGLHLTGAVVLGNAGLGGVALPLWFSVYAVAAFARPAVAAALVAAAWVLATVVQILLASAAGLSLSAPQAIVAAFGQGFFFLSCFLIGQGLRAGRHRAQDAAERAELAEARTRAEAAEAVARERNRMARELHDVAAHQVVDVLLTVRTALLTGPDPVLHEIERKSQDALDSIRSVVSALREMDVDERPREPLARAAVRVVERVGWERAIAVQHRVEVTQEPSAAAASTAISVLTEALVNAATHAPGAPVEVDLRSDETRVHLEIRNPTLGRGRVAEAGGSGYGLLGAAERAHLLSGSLRSGIDTHGDWVVLLEVPASSESIGAAQ